jgi:hypothetical protein
MWVLMREVELRKMLMLSYSIAQYLTYTRDYGALKVNVDVVA